MSSPSGSQQRGHIGVTCWGLKIPGSYPRLSEQKSEGEIHACVLLKSSTGNSDACLWFGITLNPFLCQNGTKMKNTW